MNPLQAYQQTRQTSQPRIELILSVFDRAVERLQACQRQPRDPSVPRKLGEARLLIGSLAAGMNLEASPLEANFARLYEFVVHSLSESPPRVDDALEILRVLGEAFAAIRDQALEQERAGLIPPLESTGAIAALA